MNSQRTGGEHGGGEKTHGVRGVLEMRRGGCTGQRMCAGVGGRSSNNAFQVHSLTKRWDVWEVGVEDRAKAFEGVNFS